jgi:hypothetical protein
MAGTPRHDYAESFLPADDVTMSAAASGPMLIENFRAQTFAAKVGCNEAFEARQRRQAQASTS